jgi:hypothetical protein
MQRDVILPAVDGEMLSRENEYMVGEGRNVGGGWMGWIWMVRWACGCLPDAGVCRGDRREGALSEIRAVMVMLTTSSCEKDAQDETGWDAGYMQGKPGRRDQVRRQFNLMPGALFNAQLAGIGLRLAASVQNRGAHAEACARWSHGERGAISATTAQNGATSSRSAGGGCHYRRPEKQSTRNGT